MKKMMIQESAMQVGVCVVENVYLCLRTRKAFAVVIQTKYLTIILKVNHKT